MNKREIDEIRRCLLAETEGPFRQEILEMSDDDIVRTTAGSLLAAAVGFRFAVDDLKCALITAAPERLRKLL